MCYKEKTCALAVIIKKAKYFNNKMKISDKCTFSKEQLQSNKRTTCKTFDQYAYCLIIQRIF